MTRARLTESSLFNLRLHLHTTIEPHNMAPPRPRWETNKKKPPAAKTPKARGVKVSDDAVTPFVPSLPLELQQLLLNIFKNSFAERFATDIQPLLQEVKSHLYNRDFTTAFGKDEYLETYAARWSPSRALGYAELFWDLREHLWSDKKSRDGSGVVESNRSRKIVCLGGGAGAELVALAGVQKFAATEQREAGDGEVTMEVLDVDIADWTTIVETLTNHMTTAPPVHKYASAAIKAANSALVSPDKLVVSFQQEDVLNADFSALKALLNNATLVTLMFTLNELYSTSLPLTQRFLLHLTSALPTGAMLLVVDSAGSYSSVTLNGAEKKYPMQWLLDHTLLRPTEDDGSAKTQDEEAKWEKVQEDESRWFRLEPALQYPIELENMRMQLHLYRRL
jgi:25S rRNA (uracil2843-N3)-methyltransferase